MSLQQPEAKIITNKAKKVSIAAIESELDGLWSQFNKNISGGETVMRACMSNLIIYCDTDEQAKQIRMELIDIVDVHPARILLLTGQSKAKKDSIAAYISIYYMHVPDGLQVCAEQIDVVSTAENISKLPSVARSQLIGDLPTALWWASTQPPPEAGEVFFQLAELADQIIYDNMGWPNPIKGVAAMTRWVASQQDETVVYNLAWRRTANWRKLLSQVLDPRAIPEALNSLHLIEIDHGPHALAMSWLLIGWLGAQLQWQPKHSKALSHSEMVWQFRKDGRDIKVVARRRPEGEPLLYQLLFDWSKADNKGHTCFERLDEERIGIVETLSTVTPRVFATAIPKRSALVAAQLAHRERDKVLENALKVCNGMSEVFEK